MNLNLYRTVWRWHFYAGIIVLPLVVILSLSGALYLFKPQIERWEERQFQHLPTDHAVSASTQVEAALTGEPHARFAYYRLPERQGDAAMIHLASADGGMKDVFVSPQGVVLGQIDANRRIVNFDRKLHGQLLMGRRGSWLVEWAASWAIVLIVTGLFLWWPRNRGLGGVFWPRWELSGRAFWRDLHAVVGFWVAGLALVLLFTGLPWADAWGSAFKAVRQQVGWVKGAQDWTIGGRVSDGSHELHAEHDHAAMLREMADSRLGAVAATPKAIDSSRLDEMVEHAVNEQIAFPAMVIPPGAPAGEGGQGKPAKGWVVKSDAQNRPLRVTLRYDATTGKLQSREDFASRHPIDKVIAVGVAWHEGQLLGTFNQVVGAATAGMLVTVVVSGFMMWRRRKPPGELGAPRQIADSTGFHGIGPWIVFLFLLIWLPLMTATLMVIVPIEKWVLPRFPRLARWLGV